MVDIKRTPATAPAKTEASIAGGAPPPEQKSPYQTTKVGTMPATNGKPDTGETEDQKKRRKEAIAARRGK